MSKKNIYSWNIQKKNDFIKNQNVSININNNYICVTPIKLSVLLVLK